MTSVISPALILRLAPPCTVAAFALCLALLSPGLYLALVASPPDYQHGETVRIMYVHVPAAWMATAIYAFMAVCAVVALIWRLRVPALFVAAVAPMGFVFAALCLVTGALWGQLAWGTWWVWDARLTSVLALCFFYAGYLILCRAFENRARGETMALYLVALGAIDLPIIKFSVTWWNTLHQPASLLRRGGPTIDPSLLTPLLLMLGAITAFAFALFLVRTRTLLLRARLLGRGTP